jgi:CRISP-associated protein Cas1
MIKRTIDISSDAAARLRIENGQLVIEREHVGSARVACEDVGILLIDQQRVVYSHAVMTRLMEAGACVVLCGEDHLPCGLMLPLEGNELLTQRLRRQVEVSRPLEKRIWQRIVRAKIGAQAGVLEEAGRMRGRVGAAMPGMEEICGETTAAVRRLVNMVEEVNSGDETNVEGQAARVYWAGLMGDGFRRARGGAWPNPVLNYGYAVMRAAVARAIAGAGLHPSFGVHHHNRGNAFCLADDLVEPLRPLVDAAVVGLMEAGREEITPGVKRVLLRLLVWEVELGGQKGPLMVQLQRVAAGLWDCYGSGEARLELPRYGVGRLMEGDAHADV